MFVFILILLLFAAVFGVLGTVLKVTAILVLSVILAVAVLAGLAWWGLKRKARQFQAEYNREVTKGSSSSPPPTFRPNEADPGELPARDDRY
jgi:flagellar basal body-associated protein FliL